MRSHILAWVAATMIFTVGCLILIDNRTINATRLHEWKQLGHPNLVGVGMLVSSTVAVFGLCRGRRVWRWLYLQQFVLIVAAVGALAAMNRSAFGDGVIRPRAFIIADQLPAVLIAIFHLSLLIPPVANQPPKQGE